MMDLAGVMIVDIRSAVAAEKRIVLWGRRNEIILIDRSLTFQAIAHVR
jgi:hypothetical protein